MEVICIEEKAFYLLLEKVLEHIKDKNGTKESKWISGDEAMQKLAITSKTTLRQYRNKGKIRFTQPKKKASLYDVHSIDEYLDQRAKDRF